MEIINQSSQTISCGAYRASDHSFGFTLFPWGSKINIDKNSSYKWDNPDNLDKVQIIVWEAKKKTGPETVLTSHDVTYTATGAIVGQEAGVHIKNYSGNDVEVGVYSIHDYEYTMTLLPWGTKQKIENNDGFDWSNQLNLDRVQVIFFVGNQQYRRTIHTKSTITLGHDGTISCNEAGVLFENKYGKNVQLGVYNISDKSYMVTLFPYGQFANLFTSNIFDWQNESQLKKIQVVIYDGEKRIAKKTVFTNHQVTLTDDGRIISDTDSPEQKVEHIVVVMLENRSFDNVTGWLYDKDNNIPPRNIPENVAPTFDGLKPDTYFNVDPITKNKIYASKVVGKENVPDPNPAEVFPAMHQQIFYPDDATNQEANMKGFVANYLTKTDKPAQIMKCYTPEVLPVLSTIAKDYAICDRWFGSAPCETWPNRSFFHAGTSFGRLNNCDGEHTEDCVPNYAVYAGKRTIFDVLDEQGIEWTVYKDSVMPSVTSSQFFPILDSKRSHVELFGKFKSDAKQGTLPAYSFIEPEFFIGANDQHPPHDMQKGEEFLQAIWNAVKMGPNWNKTLLIITYDEHGGCYDHVHPPHTAIKPDNSPSQFPFDFELFGPRVPTVLASPYIQKGTVFCSAPGEQEYDHTSMLATLRDWIWVHQLKPDSSTFLPSARAEQAPSIWNVLTRSSPRTDIPDIKVLESRETSEPAVVDKQLNSLQKAVLVDAEVERRAKELHFAHKDVTGAVIARLFEEAKATLDEETAHIWCSQTKRP